MRIGLMVYGSLERATGGNIFDRMLVAGLRAQGDQVEVISLRPRGVVGRLSDNFAVRVRRTPDVLLQDELTHLSLLRLNARSRSYPIVSIVHNLHSSEPRPGWQNVLYRPVEQVYLRSVDGLIFNSLVTFQSVSSGLGINKPYVVAAPGGDRLGSARAAAVTSRAHAEGPLRLIFLANVTPLKGLHVLLDALALLDPHLFELEVVGSCEVQPQYARDMQRKAMDLRAGIAFHGPLDGKALARRLAHAQAMVIPSYYEGFGIAYLEGMAYGLPAIGTTAGAIPELIRSGVTGFLVAPGDSRGLAQLISRLASDRRLLATMAASALRHYRSQPTWMDCTTSVREFLVQVRLGTTLESPQRRR